MVGFARRWGVCFLSTGCAVMALAPSARADIMTWSAGFKCDNSSVVASASCKDGDPLGAKNPILDLSPNTPVYGCVGTTRCSSPLGTVATWNAENCQLKAADGGGWAVDPTTCKEGWGCTGSISILHQSSATGTVGTTCAAAAAYDKICLGETECSDTKVCTDPSALASGVTKLTACPDNPTTDAGGTPDGSTPAEAGVVTDAGASPAAPAEDSGGCSIVTTRSVAAGFALLFGLALLAQRRRRS